MVEWGAGRDAMTTEGVANETLDRDGAARRYPLLAAMLPLVAAAAVARVLLGSLLPGDATIYLGPGLASILVFGAFWLILRRKLDDNVFGELGFLYLALIAVYTLVPAVSFMTASFFQGGPLDQLLPDPTQLRTHLWRQVLFEAGVATGYLLVRGRVRWEPSPTIEGGDRDGRALLFIALLTLVAVAAVTQLSAPVESYYDNYTRFDHLPWLLHKFVSLCIRMSLGLYCLLLVFLFRNYQKYKLIIPVALAVICAYEIVYSLGARIQALLVLLQAATLYHLTVKKISLKWAVVAGVVVVLVFSVIELIRLQDFTFGAARDVVAGGGLKPASELIAVFFPGFHLYAERAAGTLPPHEWPMFFSDFISLFTFGDFVRWNPMVWYANNYYPQAEVPPFTLGPIADSAIWGGEIDLVVRSLINGIFFASIVRWFLRYGDRWWGLAVYVYCVASCILTIKYSVFLDLNLIEKNLLPVLILVYAARVLRFSGRADRTVVQPSQSVQVPQSSG